MHLTFRTDASSQIGTGHAMRCLALAQAWQDAGGNASFVMVSCPPSLEDRLAREGIAVLHLAESIAPGSEADGHETAAIARESSTGECDDWVVVDGYHFGADYQQSLQALCLRLLFWDDAAHCPHYSADLVLNQNLGAEAHLYPSRSEHTRLLLGTRYAVLRREFRQLRAARKDVPAAAQNLLVTLGGSDPANLTPRVLTALDAVGTPLHVTVLVGGSATNLAEAEAAAASSRHAVRILRNAPNIAELMAQSDLAISAAGSTVWELCSLGVPSLLIAVADNQQPSAAAMQRAAAALVLPGPDFAPQDLAEKVSALLPDAATRLQLARRAHALVDGLGAARVVAHLLGQPEPATAGVHLRPVRPEDRDTLRQWRNLPEVRRYMMHPLEVAAADHERWFARMLANPAAHYHVIVRDGRDIGIIHLTALADASDICEWGFYVAQEDERGMGSASAAWFLALEEAFGPLGFREVRAEVLDHNAASLHLHRAFGFTELGALRQHAAEGGSATVFGFSLERAHWQLLRGEIAARLERRGLLPG